MGKKKLSEARQSLDRAGKNYKETLDDLSSVLAVYSSLINNFSSRYELSAEEEMAVERLKIKVIELKKQKEDYENRYKEHFPQDDRIDSE